MDPRRVRRPGHGPPEGVDLPGQMSLADAADGGVAAHLAERLYVLGEQQRARAHTGARQGSLGSGVPTTDHDQVELLGMLH